MGKSKLNCLYYHCQKEIDIQNLIPENDYIGEFLCPHCGTRLKIQYIRGVRKRYELKEKPLPEPLKPITTVEIILNAEEIQKRLDQIIQMMEKNGFSDEVQEQLKQLLRETRELIGHETQKSELIEKLTGKKPLGEG